MPAAATGGVPPLNVQIVIRTVGVGAAASGMKTVTSATKGMSKGFAAGTISSRTLGDAMRQSATLMKYTVAGGFMQIGQAAMQASRNFELSFSRIKGLVGISTDSIEAMKKSVLEMATDTTRGPEELADALYFITSAGLRDSAVAMDVLNKSARAAAAGLGETKTVADAVTSAINAYGVAGLSAGQATDVIVAAVREGKAEADTMAPAFSKVLPVAAAFGASFEDVAAAVAALSRSGMTAGTAGIYVRQTLSQLLKPSKQASEALYAVGTSAGQIRKEVQEQGLFVALQNLSAKLGGVKNAEGFAKVFGNVRALTAVLQLVGPAAAENQEIFERLQNSTGDLDDAFNAYSTTTDSKFQKASAAQKVALIELGDTIEPIVGGLLELSTTVSKIATSLLKIPGAGIFTKILGGVTLAVAALAIMMKTASAVVRLISNMSIALRGTGFMYDATTRSVYRYSMATGTAAHATRQAALAANGWTPANIKLNFSLKSLRASLLALGATIKAVAFQIGMFVAVTAAIAAAAFAISYFRKKNQEVQKELYGTSKALADVNELLDEQVKYGKSNLLFNVDVNVDEANLKVKTDRLRQQFEDQAPGYFEALSKTIEDIGGIGSESGKAYLVALMNSVYGGMTGETKEAIKALFEQEFKMSPADWGSIMVPKETGDAVADALIYTAVAAAAASSEEVYNQMGKVVNLDAFTEMLGKSKVLDDFFTDAANDSMTAFGKSFTDVIQETQGNIAPLLVAMREIDKAGQMNQQSLEKIVGPALKGLTDGFDLASESTGDFSKIFGDASNADELIKMISETTGVDTGRAVAVYHDMREEIENLPPGVNKSTEAFRIFSNGLGEATNQTKKLDEATVDNIKNLDQYVETLKTQVETYESNTSAMKQYTEAFRALQGMTLTQTELNRDLQDSYQDVGDAVAKSNGDLSGGTEASRKAQSEIQKTADDVVELAAAYAAAGDDEGAGEVFAKGMANIVSVATQAGGEKGGVAAAQLLENMGFTADNFRDSLLVSAAAIDGAAVQTGAQVTTGIAKGIQSGAPTMSQAIVQALQGVVVTAKNYFETKSPSRLMAREIGMPAAQGVAVGFAKEAQSPAFKSVITKSLDNAVAAAYKSGGRKGASKFFADFLKKKGKVETPAQDFVKATIGRMKDIIGSLGNYINSQLNFRKAQTELAKLINMQRGLDDRRKKAAREVQYAETRRGLGGGAQVTGYEQAEIDQLQIDFERTSRDYAMGRATYNDLVDAEISLFEARAAAVEANDEVLNAQNSFIDATVEVENKSLNLAAATVSVLESYADVIEAGAELYYNHKELAGVYDTLAIATGIASGKIIVGSKDLSTLGSDVQNLGGFTSTVGGYVSTLGNNVGITGQAFSTQFFGEDGIFKTLEKTGTNVNTLTKSIGADFTNMSAGLLNPESFLQKNLLSLGPSIWEAIKTGAQEAFDASPLNLRVSVNAVVDKSGSGSVNWKVEETTGVVTSRNSTYVSPAKASQMVTKKASILAPRAVGGPVKEMTPYLVGERGPEMFVPKVSGTIVTTSALDRYTRTRPNREQAQQSPAANNIMVTVNNPVPEAAQDSITRRMKVLANSGMFG
jgi:TP901 family phage tail tape measure protein